MQMAITNMKLLQHFILVNQLLEKLKTFNKWKHIINSFKELSILKNLIKEKVNWYLDKLIVKMENLTDKCVSVFFFFFFLAGEVLPSGFYLFINKFLYTQI